MAMLEAAEGAAPDLPLFSLRNVSKRFGGEQALDGVDLDIWAGEVHGLLGHNGSGKSTLIKVLSGYHAPDQGAYLVARGETYRPPLSPEVVRSLGLSFVHQDLGLIGSLSVLENLSTSDIAAARWHIPWKHLRAKARRLLTEFGLEIDIDARVDDLLPWHRSLLAVVRAVASMRDAIGDSGSAGALVLDEPTARMSEDTVERLLATIHQIASLGHAVLLVSHDLDEVLQVTDRVTVLRDGRLVASLLTADTTRADLVELIVGRPPTPSRALARSAGNPADVAQANVRVDGLSGGIVKDFAFEFRSGEVTGITGLVGSGFDEIGSFLFGERQAAAGDLHLGSEPIAMSQLTAAKAVGLGIGFIPPDRHSQGCITQLTVTDNLAMPALRTFTKRGSLRWEALRRHVRDWLGRLAVVPPQPAKVLQELSGGNQQKVLVAKWLQLSPRLLIAVEPTQGVDVGARAEILRFLRDYAQRGNVVVCCSTDVDQLVDVCDTACVVHKGALTGVLRGEEITKRDLTTAVFGGALTAREDG